VATLLRMVIDDLSPAERSRRASEFVGIFPDARAALETLVGDPDRIVHELAERALQKLTRAPERVAAAPQAEERT